MTALRGLTDRLAPDADLLTRFARTRDEPAFAELVRRHGPLVLGVCRRVVPDRHLADDAFQASFLVLAKKAAAVDPRRPLAGFLYGVAYRVALRARTMAGRRRKRETLTANVPDVGSVPRRLDDTAELDEAIARLPAAQREAVVLCELEGVPRAEAASRLGVPPGTLSSRLAAARKALADRLRDRGVVAVPASLAAAAVGQAAATLPTPAAVADLARGELLAMFLTKLKRTAAGLLAVACAGAVLASARPVRSDDPPKPAARPAAAAAAKPAGPGTILLWKKGELHLLDPLGKAEAKVLAFDGDHRPREAALSPDGKRVAYSVPFPDPAVKEAQNRHKVFVRGIDEPSPGTELCVVGGGMLCWSADGTELVVNDFTDSREGIHSNLFVVDVKTKVQAAVKLPATHLVTGWSRDGKRFLTTAVEPSAGPGKGPPSARLFLMNRDGTEHKSLAAAGLALGRLSPDDARVLAMRTPAAGSRAPRELVVVDVKTGAVAPVADVPENAELQGYCWSPDGKKIAYTWRQVHGGTPDDVKDKETESFLIVCDPDGKNPKTLASEKGSGPGQITLMGVDWR